MSTGSLIPPLREKEPPLFQAPAGVNLEQAESPASPIDRLTQSLDLLNSASGMKQTSGQQILAALNLVRDMGVGKETEANFQIHTFLKTYLPNCDPEFLDNCPKGMHHLQLTLQEATQMGGQYFVAATDFAKSFANNTHLDTAPGSTVAILSNAFEAADELLRSFETIRTENGYRRRKNSSKNSIDNILREFKSDVVTKNSGQLALKNVA